MLERFAVEEMPTPLMLSALQHYLFCPRQCALIHTEGVWRDNFFTAAGNALHERVDGGSVETRKAIHYATALRISSVQLGLSGVADMVEFHRQDRPINEHGCIVAVKIPGQSGFWCPFPVEYKYGKPKEHRADEVQLCAQGLCLEEMLGVSIPSGALFYGKIRRRIDIPFDEALRTLTRETVANVRNLLNCGETPPPIYTKACEACSIKDECLPEKTSIRHSARRWLVNRISEVVTE